MSTIQELFQQAQLAEAAYAKLTTAIGNQNELKNALDVAFKETYGGSFSSTQATDFVTHWRVVSQYTASGFFGRTDGSGFSATVFESLDHPGQYTVSMRGTQVPWTADLSTDLGDIVADGGASALYDRINTTDRISGMGSAANDACFEGERRAA